MSSFQNFANTAKWAISQLDTIMSSNPMTTPNEPPNLATKLHSLHQRDPSFTERHLTDMLLTHFGAGLETLGITLSALLCNIVQRPALQARIQDEIDVARKCGQLNLSSDGILKIGEMKQKLSLLEATLRESMRLHPVVGVSFPRVVGGGGLLIDGFMIPAGVSFMHPLMYCNIDRCRL